MVLCSCCTVCVIAAFLILHICSSVVGFCLVLSFLIPNVQNMTSRPGDLCHEVVHMHARGAAQRAYVGRNISSLRLLLCMLACCCLR